MPLVARPHYLEELVRSIGDGRVKVVTGIRRCGKTVLVFDQFREHLRASGVDDAHVIEVRLDLRENAPLRDPDRLYDFVLGRIVDDAVHYVLIDEVQEAISPAEFLDIRYGRPALYGVMNGLLARGNLEVFVTGSNSRFLSSDIMTEFRDRGTEVRVHPFSFAEFASAREGDPRDLLDDYLVYGGLPTAVLEPDEGRRRRYLHRLFDSTYRRDIVQRYDIKRTAEMDALARFLASNVGSLTSVQSVASTLAKDGSPLSGTTVADYLGHLSESFIVDAVRQRELRGRELLRPKAKYYFEDLGLRNALLDFPLPERGHLLENVVYGELSLRGYEVGVGRVSVRESVGGERRRTSYECDFVAGTADSRLYVQCAWSIDGDGQYEREVRPFRAIRDSWPKVLVVGDRRGRFTDADGIVVIGAIDFLLDPSLLS